MRCAISLLQISSKGSESLRSRMELTSCFRKYNSSLKYCLLILTSFTFRIRNSLNLFCFESISPIFTKISKLSKKSNPPGARHFLSVLCFKFQVTWKVIEVLAFSGTYLVFMEIDFFTEILRTLRNKYNDAENALHSLYALTGEKTVTK